jgi:hypothetical protein
VSSRAVARKICAMGEEKLCAPPEKKKLNIPISIIKSTQTLLLLAFNKELKNFLSTE